MSRYKNKSLGYRLGVIIGRNFGLSLIIVALGVVSLVVPILMNIAKLFAAWTLWVDTIFQALYDSAATTGIWTVVTAHITIGLLVGFALGLRAPKPKRRIEPCQEHADHQ